jgi:hypothetical protein
MSNLINNNIFVKKSTTKYNPDILNKSNYLERDRQTNIFKENKEVLNSITNQTPDFVRSYKDLELKKDLPINNIKNIILEKNNERLEQERVQDEINRIKKINIKKISFDDLESKEKSIIHTNLKNEQNNFRKKNDNSDKYNNIVNSLNNLGILNNL